MPDEHPRGQFADGWLDALWEALDCQEKLVLLRLDSAGTRLVFTEPQKPADLKSKLRQRLKLTDCQRFCSSRHRYIVARYAFRFDCAVLLRRKQVSPAEDYQVAESGGDLLRGRVIS
jgi:hypothetical protein